MISFTILVALVIFSLYLLATSSVLLSCCFSLISFSEFTFSSFLDSTFSLTSDLLSSLGLSSNLSKTSLRVFASLSISSWVTSLLSSSFSARDKTRLSSFTDFSVFLLISVFLILSTNSFRIFLLTSFFSIAFSSFSVKTSVFITLSLEFSTCFSLCEVGLSIIDFLLTILSVLSCLATTSDSVVSFAYVTCGPLTLTPPTTKNSEHPKSMCFPFLTIRQFFCWSPCRLNNICFLLFSI